MVGRGYRFTRKKTQISVSVLEMVAWCFLIQEINFDSPGLSDCLCGASLYQVWDKPRFQVSES